MVLVGIVVRVIIFPLTIKGKRGMIQMNMLNGKMQMLQKQYKGNPTRYNEELQKLYEREGVNPMSGCLWSFIPMLIILPIFYILREPIHYMMGLSIEEIHVIAQALNWKEVAVSMGWATPEAIEKALIGTTKVAGQLSGFSNGGYNQLYLSSLINEQTLPTVQAALSAAGFEGANIFALNFNFLGLNLAAIPTWKIWTAEGFTLHNIGLSFLVLLSVAAMFLSMQISTKTNKINQGEKKGNDNASADQMNKTMMYTMPLIYLFFGFVMPGVMCLYFIASSAFGILQELLAARILKKDYEKARLVAAEREAREKEEEKERKRLRFEQNAQRMEEEKANRNKKKPLKKQSNVPEGINKDDSREGMRTYARGRAYDPSRFGEVTPYFDLSKQMTQSDAEREEEEIEQAAQEMVAAREAERQAAAQLEQAAENESALNEHDKAEILSDDDQEQDDETADDFVEEDDEVDNP